MIDICCVGSGVKYHSLFHWSIVMTSPIELSTDEFSAKQYESPLKWHNQPGKKVKDLESLLCKIRKLCNVFIFFF